MQRRVSQRCSSAARQQLSVVPGSRDSSLLHQADSFAFSAFEEGIDQSISTRCLDSSADCGGDVCQVEAAEHRVGLFSQLLLDMGSIAVKATLPEICRCVCQAGDTCLAMLGCRAHRFWSSNQGMHEAAACWSRSSLCSREPQSSISFGRFLSGMTEKRSSR